MAVPAPAMTQGTWGESHLCHWGKEILEAPRSYWCLQRRKIRGTGPSRVSHWCRVNGQDLPLCCPPPLHLSGLTFFTDGLIRGIRAVGSTIAFQEAVNAAAIATVELSGVTGARAHWVEAGWESGGEVRLQQRPESTKGLPSTWPSLPQQSIMTCSVSFPPPPLQSLPFFLYTNRANILIDGC